MAERWPGKFRQADKWKICLRAAIVPRIGSNNGKTSTSVALAAHHLAHQTFTDVNALDQAIHTAVQDLNRERMAVPLANPRISA